NPARRWWSRVSWQRECLIALMRVRSDILMAARFSWVRLAQVLRTTAKIHQRRNEPSSDCENESQQSTPAIAPPCDDRSGSSRAAMGWRFLRGSADTVAV